MLSKKIIGKCNLLNSTICQELFNMGIIWKFQMTHCTIKNMHNKLFEIGIIYYFFICYVFFWGSSAQLHLINFHTDCVWTNHRTFTCQLNSCPHRRQLASTMSRWLCQWSIPSLERLSAATNGWCGPTTAETWQKAIGKDFGGMAQGDLKTGQKDTNSIFLMTHEEISRIPPNQMVTYAHVVVNFWPQKANSHHIRITAGKNLINYLGELSTCTADITTSKLMWNSVLSPEGA